jgi:hypothetical protein
MMIPANMDWEDFAERKALGTAYLALMARASREQRTKLLVEWAEKLYDAHAVRRVRLLQSSDDIPRLLIDLDFYYSGTITSLLADAHPDDFESEAISLAIAGRRSYWFTKSALPFFPATAVEQSSRIAEFGQTTADAHSMETRATAFTQTAVVRKRGTRGPKRDFLTALKVDEVVRRLAPDRNWRAQLENICDGLDEGEVRLPKPWKKKGYGTWYDCMTLARPLVIKAIEHHLERAREHEKLSPDFRETIS